MKRRTLIKGIAITVPSLFLPKVYANAFSHFNKNSIAEGPFKPTWESLENYKTPDWFSNAKFGLWAHWSPQCVPEFGEGWYARSMYEEGSIEHNFHLKKYGHPSKFGFKDIVNIWKAERWDPDELVALYKKAGAKYFVALANHHDNFDLWDSKFQEWNSVKIGPKKDIVAGWARAAHRNGLPFGLSIHAAHAWSWMETAQRSDKVGPFAGIPYDGKIKKSDGKGLWWDGLDPQELYAQNHPLSENSWNNDMIHRQWSWGNGVYPPSIAYNEKFYNRTIDLIDKYKPELLYFDDTVLPLWPVSDVGLRIAAYFYNNSINKHGSLQAVINGKILSEQQRKCMVWDIERGQTNEIQPLPWQTDTCIGNWHYDRRIYNNDSYRSSGSVIQALVDIVSKNGNLLLNIPVRGDGSIDDKERLVVEEIGEWMSINQESIYDTRPWKIFGEGPAQLTGAALTGPGFNEGKGKTLTAEDIRFVTKGKILYATFFGWSKNIISIKSLGNNSPYLEGRKINSVSLVGYDEKLKWSQETESLKLTLPDTPPCKSAYVLRIT